MSNAGGHGNGLRQTNRDGHLGDELLGRLVDGDLTPEDRRHAEAHLATCAGCRESRDALRSTVALLHGLPSPRPARSFQLAPAYARRPSGWNRVSGWLTTGMPALRAAVVALVLIAGGIAAFGALRDDERLTRDAAPNVQTESTVAPTGGALGPTLVATVADPPLEQAQATTPAAADAEDVSASRSGQEAGAAEMATSTPVPTETVQEEAPPVSAAPAPASTATVAPAATSTPERETIFGIQDERGDGDAPAATRTPATDGDAAGDASEDADAVTSDAVAPQATATQASAAERPESESSRVESTVDEGSEDAEGQEDDSGESSDAPADSAADESAPATSAALAEVTPTATATPPPTATHQPATSAATPSGSPPASPVASPAATPVDTAANRQIPIDGATMVDTMTSRRSYAMLALAIALMIGGIVVALRTVRGTVG